MQLILSGNVHMRIKIDEQSPRTTFNTMEIIPQTKYKRNELDMTNSKLQARASFAVKEQLKGNVSIIWSWKWNHFRLVFKM